MYCWKVPLHKVEETLAFYPFSTLPSEDMSHSLGNDNLQKVTNKMTFSSYSWLKTTHLLQYQCCLRLERTSVCKNLLVKKTRFSTSTGTVADKSLFRFLCKNVAVFVLRAKLILLASCQYKTRVFPWKSLRLWLLLCPVVKSSQSRCKGNAKMIFLNTIS